MLDENLPTFYLKASKDSVKHNATLYLSQFGSDASPVYTLRHPDPASADAKNRYAAALCDAYNPDILYGEVLVVPEWTQPSLSQEEIRKNGGVPPPPQAIQPTEFTIQLYNPDQQIVVRSIASTWKEAQHFEFEVPQQTFRQPSASTLDRTQHDPSAMESTPTIVLKWKREGKLSKDLICNLSGKSKNPDGSKKKNKEPDIPMAFFRNLREMTVYEPNLQRVEVEDPKGFEVILLLGAIVIKDVFFGQMREVFNISETARQQNVVVRQNQYQPTPPTISSRPQQQPPPQQPPRNQLPAQANAVSSQRPNLSVATSSSRPPPTDPRSQWELDAEAARLRKLAEQDEKERKRREKEDAKMAKKMAEDEEREARKRQENADKEHERLRQEYFAEQRRMGRQSVPPPSHSGSYIQQPNRPPQAPPRMNGTYLQPQHPSGPCTQAAGPSRPVSGGMLGPPQNNVKPRRSGFLGLRSRSDESQQQRLLKKQSAIF